MALQIGDAAVSSVYIGADPVSRIHIGDDLVWQAGAGMEKVGEWSPSSGSSFNTIPGWRAQAQFPGTVIVGDGIELQAGTYTLTLRLVAGDSFDLTVRSIRILVGSTEVVPNTHAESNGWTFTTTVTVPSGVLTVQYYATSSSSARRIVREGTYLTVTKV